MPGVPPLATHYAKALLLAWDGNGHLALTVELAPEADFRGRPTGQPVVTLETARTLPEVLDPEAVRRRSTLPTELHGMAPVLRVEAATITFHALPPAVRHGEL